MTKIYKLYVDKYLFCTILKIPPSFLIEFQLMTFIFDDVFFIIRLKYQLIFGVEGRLNSKFLLLD